MANPQLATKAALEARIRSLAKRPIGRWPRISMSWDVRRETWWRSMDDHQASDQFLQRFPDIQLSWVDVAEVKTALGPGWRKASPAASPFRTKSARLVVHLEQGGRVSPPFVQPVNGRLEVNGGNHRIGWAIHMAELKMPILLLQQHEGAACALMPSLAPT